MNVFYLGGMVSGLIAIVAVGAYTYNKSETNLKVLKSGAIASMGLFLMSLLWEKLF